MFGLISRDTAARLLAGELRLVDLYNRWYLTGTALVVITLILSFMADSLGIGGAHVFFIPIWVFTILWIKTHPRVLEVLAAIAIVNRLSGDRLNQWLPDWHRAMRHIAMFGGVFGLTRFLVPISAYPFMGWVMVGALATLGLWAWIYGAGTKYRKYVALLIIVVMSIGLYGAATGKKTAPLLNGVGDLVGQLVGWSEDRDYVKEVTLTLRTLEDHEVCFQNVRPGKWYLHYPTEAKLVRSNRGGVNDKAIGFWARYQDGNGDQLSWLDNVLINGERIGFERRTEIDARGCVRVSTIGQIRDKQGEPRAIKCPTGRLDLCYPTPFRVFPEVVIRVSGKPWIGAEK